MRKWICLIQIVFGGSSGQTLSGNVSAFAPAHCQCSRYAFAWSDKKRNCRNGSDTAFYGVYVTASKRSSHCSKYFCLHQHTDIVDRVAAAVECSNFFRRNLLTAGGIFLVVFLLAANSALCKTAGSTERHNGEFRSCGLYRYTSGRRACKDYFR